jgi:hypothetical protein
MDKGGSRWPAFYTRGGILSIPHLSLLLPPSRGVLNLHRDWGRFAGAEKKGTNGRTYMIVEQLHRPRFMRFAMVVAGCEDPIFAHVSSGILLRPGSRRV